MAITLKEFLEQVEDLDGSTPLKILVGSENASVDVEQVVVDDAVGEIILCDEADVPHEEVDTSAGDKVTE